MLIYFYNPGRGINQVTDILGCYSLKCRQSNSSAVVKYSWPFTGLKSIMDNSNAYLQANNTRETKEQELTWLTLNEGEWSELESWELETCKFTRELQFSDFSASENVVWGFDRFEWQSITIVISSEPADAAMVQTGQPVWWSTSNSKCLYSLYGLALKCLLLITSLSSKLKSSTRTLARGVT